jgi:hypothetical protein
MGKGERGIQLNNGFLKMLMGSARKENWILNLRDIEEKITNAHYLSKNFRKKIRSSTDLYQNLKDCSSLFSRSGKYSSNSLDNVKLRNSVITNLKAELSSICMEELQPNLVILDEIPIRKNMFNDKNELSAAARAIFEYPDVKILLLSSTPNKTLTLDSLSDDDNHYEDFIFTLSFLFNNDERKINNIKNILSKYTAADHLRLSDNDFDFEIKRNLEDALLKVMCRT